VRLKLSPQNAGQLRKASAAPVLSVPQPPASPLPGAGPADPLPSPSGQRRRALPRPPGPCSGCPCRPRPPPSDQNCVRSRRWDPDPQRRREAALLQGWRQVRRTHPASASWLAGQAWGKRPSGGTGASNSTLSAATGNLARTRSRNSSGVSCCGGFPSLGHRRCASMALGRQGKTQQASAAASNASPGPSRRASAAAVEAGPQPGRPARGSPSPARWGGGWPGAAGKHRRGLPSPGCQPQRHGPQPAGTEPWRSWAMAPEPWPACGNSPA